MTMATRNSTDVGFLLVSGRNLLPTTTAFSDKTIAVTEETTPLGVSAPTHAFTGIVRTVLSLDGFYDDATGAQNEALVGREATAQVVCYALAGNVLARRMVGIAGAFLNAHERIVSIPGFHKAKASAEVSGARDDGVILQPLAAKTTAGNTEATSVDHGGGTAAGGAGYLQVTALTLGGYTNLIVTVRHSTNNATFTELLAFTAVTGGPNSAAQRVAVTGTVNRYLATSHAWTGAGSGMSATIMVGFCRG
jgi:hypothetical protein